VETNPEIHHSKSIKFWPAAERPRERLLREGSAHLTDSELLAILIRNGLQGKDAISLGRELLTRFGGLRGLIAASSQELQTIKGLGPAKVAALLAALEIARRQLREEIHGKNIVKDPQSVYDYLISSLRDKKKEIFKVLFLNKANRILGESDMFEGTVDQTMVHPREILRSAIERNATSVILVHNHPSGRTQPSHEDLEMTRKIRAACETAGVIVLDHIIVADNEYFSFNEHQLLE